MNQEPKTQNPEPETPKGIRRNFARRAASYDRHAAVQRFMARRLLALVEDCLPQGGRILEVGCGTGFLTARLREVCPQARLVALDLDPALVAAARRRVGPDVGVDWLVADAENLEAGPFDLIIGNAVFQWFRRPEATLRRLRQSLKPGGVLAFSTLGPGTFQELAGAVAQASQALQAPAVPVVAASSFLEAQAWQELLTAVRFRELRLSAEALQLHFPGVMAFLKDLQATGATNPQPRPFSPRLLKALVAAYQAGWGNGSIPVTYELIWAVAEK
jgi:malonyl-CoA O-methyltransferase